MGFGAQLNSLLSVWLEKRAPRSSGKLRPRTHHVVMRDGGQIISGGSTVAQVLPYIPRLLGTSLPH
ncbi:rCG56025 [Rattus norvegicus]|uniref:RCG56025 n=1 Tax=Rattus norvegicus TaxID=10116 RepID=A6IBI6_RAT|nr:rCG56025 [Rattus norvegicus]